MKIAAFLTCFIVLVSAQGPLLSTYSQMVTRRYTYQGLPELADWTPLPVSTADSFSSLGDGSFSFLTRGGRLVKYDSQSSSFIDETKLHPGITIRNNSKLVLFPYAHGVAVAVADSATIFFCLVSGQDCKKLSISLGKVNGMTYDTAYDRVIVGAANGLFVFHASSGSLQSHLLFGNIISVAANSDGTIAAGTSTLMWRTLEPRDTTSFHFFRVGGLIDASPKGLAFDVRGYLWIVSDICVNVQAPDLTFRRISGNEGLPVANLTRVTVDYSNNDVWIGSVKGVVRFEQTSERWHYYFGPSALPGPNITFGQTVYEVASFGFASEPTTAVATDGGISIFTLKTIRLEDKANEQEKLMKYFRSPSKDPHPYAGFLVGDVGLQSFGNFSSWIPQSNDNNGLWTSIYLAGEIFRYALTKDPAVKSNAWSYFEGLEFLYNVTGVKGLMARSALYQSDFPHDGTWHHSVTCPGWIWKGDTSSDEVTGHMFVYPLVYHLLAENASEKQRAYRLIDDTMRYIVKNNYQLIDVTGKPTTWGRWDPYTLNQLPDWYQQRGLNSLQIISWIVSAYAITKDEIYVNAYQYLIEKHRYDVNIVNTKIEDPGDDNKSDDELEYLSYLPYLYALNFMDASKMQPDITSLVFRSIERSQLWVGKYRPSPWMAVYYYYSKFKPDPSVAPSFVADAILSLREWSWEIVDWPVDNSHRLDTIPNRDLNRFGIADSLTLLPYGERNQLRWNADPFDLSPGGSGTSATDPGGYVFAYWFSRWVGLGL